MARLAELADSVRQTRPGRLLVVAGAASERGLLARSLAQELRYSLRDVVSKYIGETEKNLARLLARADQPATVLFFDEADSLFGKRTEVKDSHDRYLGFLSALRSAHSVVVLGVERPERLPLPLREQARVVRVPDYWPPR